MKIDINSRAEAIELEDAALKQPELFAHNVANLLSISRAILARLHLEAQQHPNSSFNFPNRATIPALQEAIVSFKQPF